MRTIKSRSDTGVTNFQFPWTLTGAERSHVRLKRSISFSVHHEMYTTKFYGYDYGYGYGYGL